MERGRLIMSRYDYAASEKLAATSPSFEALVMAALRRADSTNAATLRAAFPYLCAEAQARYDAPGGILADDPDAVDELAQRIDPEAFLPPTAEDDETVDRPRAQDRARDWARSRLGLLHEPGEPEQTPHPGGKDGFWRVPCAHRNCEYYAWQASRDGAVAQVRQHATDKRAAEAVSS
jgi:hypothetical protein